MLLDEPWLTAGSYSVHAVGDGCDGGGGCEESPRGRVSVGAPSVHCSRTCGERGCMHAQ